MRHKVLSAAQCSIEREVGVSQGRISMRAVAATLLQPVSNYFLNNSQLFPRLFLNNFFENWYAGSTIILARQHLFLLQFSQDYSKIISQTINLRAVAATVLQPDSNCALNFSSPIS